MQVDAMILFRRAIAGWFPHIARVAYCSNLEVEPAEHGEFTVVARWPATTASPAGQHSIFFSRERVLGRSATKPPLHQRPVKKVCRFRDDIIREILQQRGI